MGKRGYAGGSTILGAGSGWFTYGDANRKKREDADLHSAIDIGAGPTFEVFEGIDPEEPLADIDAEIAFLKAEIFGSKISRPRDEIDAMEKRLASLRKSRAALTKSGRKPRHA